MASLQSNLSVVDSNSLRAGLIYQAVGLNQHLKVALGEAGVNVVGEFFANALVADEIGAHNLDVFVVNLDPELEDHLDELTDMLDRFDRPVIFNDGSSSASLAGWDQARWARHLAAKIKGELSTHPPRPVGSASIPSPQKVVKAAPVAQVVKSASQATPAVAPAINSAAVAVAVLAVTPPASLLKTLEIPVVQAPSDLGVGFAELDFDFDSKPELARMPTEAESTVMDDFDASAFDFAESTVESEPQSPRSHAALTDFDALFSEEKITVDPLPKKSTSSTVAELDFDFDSLSFDETPIVETKAEKSPTSEFKAAPSSWSLEPLGDEIAAEPPTGRASFTAKSIEPIKLPEKAKTPEAPVAVEEFSTDLGGLDFFAEPTHAPTVKESKEKQPPMLEPVADNFDELFAEFEIASPAPAQNSPRANSTGKGNAGSEFEFDMDFDIDSANPPASKSAGLSFSQSSSQSLLEDDFSDLDALFADPPAAPVRPISSGAALIESSAGPRRVFILGASIGGPEAVRSFLARLKSNVPAAFVLAQHMGAEFLELMTSQLAKASPLPVRLAKPGDKFVEGEIFVVPVSQRFVVNAESVVEFTSLPGESPYSPSIDQVMTDMADRFGARATGVIFSGMASDAIEGAKYLATKGCKVWVQDPSTCVISSMIDGAQAAGVVSFVGGPEELAERVLSELSNLS